MSPRDSQILPEITWDAQWLQKESYRLLFSGSKGILGTTEIFPRIAQAVPESQELQETSSGSKGILGTTEILPIKAQIVYMSPRDSQVLPGTPKDFKGLRETPKDSQEAQKDSQGLKGTPSGSKGILGTAEIITNKTEASSDFSCHQKVSVSCYSDFLQLNENSKIS